MKISYKDSGVDITKGYDLVSRISSEVASTQNNQVLPTLGKFGALYELQNYTNPVLVSGTDGVGTKLLLAIRHNSFEHIGQDCVAMCVNDILCHGAKPLFFLDYLACGSLDTDTAQTIITSIARACKICECALVGGETAEMPGLYQKGDYDVAGFSVGLVEKNQIIDGSKIQEGDVIIGCASNGLHSNGFSLVRALFEDSQQDFNGTPLYTAFLEPTRLYVPHILPIIHKYTASNIKGIAHITGGGLIENIPRIIPNGLCANINRQHIPSQAIFELIRNTNKIEELELWNTLNMGVGMALVVEKDSAESILADLQASELPSFVLGQIIQNQQAPTKSFYLEQKLCLQ